MLIVALQILLRRLIAAIPIVLVVSLVVFVIFRVLQVDPIGAMLPPNSTEEDRALLRATFGFDKPIWQQYLIWIGNFFTGNLGLSLHFRQSVALLIGNTLPATLELVLLGMLAGVALGTTGGLLLYGMRRTPLGPILEFGTSLLMAVPEFLWAILLIIFFGVLVPLFPFIGRIDPALAVPVQTGFLLVDTLLAWRWDSFFNALYHMILPATTIAFALAPLLMRVLRSSLTEVMHESYVTVARLRGLNERRILVRHALKNASLPTVSLIGVQVGFVFGGTLLVEVIFSYPGLGNLMVDAVRNTDLPIIQAASIIYCVVVLGANLVVDVAYVALNPKIRVR
ncbi:MAG: ABC transporter permease [Alphaproteobacteria bacterium]